MIEVKLRHRVELSQCERDVLKVMQLVLDDATSRLAAKFYRSGTVEAHMDRLETWLRKYGRPHE